MFLMLGCTVREVRRVPAGGNRQGANGDLRVDAELLLVFDAPPKTDQRRLL